MDQARKKEKKKKELLLLALRGQERLHGGLLRLELLNEPVFFEKTDELGTISAGLHYRLLRRALD